ncbi:MAG TPA: plastocyanin/azurin family copper-binding protein [Geodermatophilus sp.]|nr:plastocyanin/azurin family copper-binding protein [Geodermatophilus sp.]
MPRSTGSIAPGRRLGPARRGAALVLALALGLLSACGGSDDEAAGDTPAATQTPDATTSESTSAAPTAEAGESETVTATEGEMFIRLSEDSYSAGSYTFQVVNEGRMPHDLKVERDGAVVAGTEVIQPGGTATLTVDLEAGEYILFCSVGQHRANGMEVPITVGS